MKKIKGTMQQVKPIEVNVDTVYIRTNITRVKTEDFTGWEYDEEQYNIRDYVENLSSSTDVGMLALMMSMLMNEVDMLKSEVIFLKGGN